MSVPNTPSRPKPHFRNLRVEQYQPREFLPGLEAEDVTNLSPVRYVVTFEYRRGWRGKWQKVRGYA